MTSHDTLAISICNEIIEKDNSFGIFTLAKALNMLDISWDNTTLTKDLHGLSKRLLQVNMCVCIYVCSRSVTVILCM